MKSVVNEHYLISEEWILSIRIAVVIISKDGAGHSSSVKRWLLIGGRNGTLKHHDRTITVSCEDGAMRWVRPSPKSSGIIGMNCQGRPVGSGRRHDFSSGILTKSRHCYSESPSSLHPMKRVTRCAGPRRWCCITRRSKSPPELPSMAAICSVRELPCVMVERVPAVR